MLIGREAELAQIQRLLADAKDGRGGALVVRGEAGIGKTALLDGAIEAAEGFRVLRALGVESEAEIPFAGLHELVRPIVHLAAELPETQSKAINAALALNGGGEPDRFSVYAATLALLAAAAAEEPVLGVIDDGHWLDQESRGALLFTARRIDHDCLVLVFAARDPGGAFSAPGLPELRIGLLTAEEAQALLAARARPLLPAVAERIIEAARGNPLALLEFAEAATESELGSPLPVGEAVERTFLERSSRLSPPAQRALRLAAASDPEEPEALWAALELEGIGMEALLEAERANLLVRGRRLDFAHPLARSALYQSAGPAERRAAHLALAQTTKARERRAWHRAAAASDTDKEAADELEAAATAARLRGGVAAEAAALERSALLTPDQELQARRLVQAGRAADAAGLFERAEHLLAEGARLTRSPELHADAVAHQAYLLYDRGEFDRALQLARNEAEQAPPSAFARVLGEVLVHRLEIAAALATAERAAERGKDVRQDPDLSQMLAWTLELAGRSEDGLRIDMECVQRVEPGTLLAIDFATHFLYLEAYPRARSLLEKIVEHERKACALGNLVYALDQMSRLETRAGRLTTAYALSLESVHLTEPLGTKVGLAAALAWLALVEAMLGRPEARGHGVGALEIARDCGDHWNEVRARASLGLEAVGRGDFSTAVDWLEPAAELLAAGDLRHPNVFRVHGDLIEAQVRLGERDAARQQLARLSEEAELTASRWARAICARCQGLLGADADIDATFTTALELHEEDPSSWERARTQLVYGERLRRSKHRRLAREQLHAALETFEEAGSRPWAERARAELRASGEHLRRRGRLAHEQLTPQELQVALAAADGLTNKQIGARLFISPKTVEFHLGNAYRKLDLRSRAELIKLFAPGGVGGAGEAALGQPPTMRGAAQSPATSDF